MLHNDEATPIDDSQVYKGDTEKNINNVSPENKKRTPLHQGSRVVKAKEQTNNSNLNGKWKTGNQIRNLKITDIPTLWSPFFILSGIVGLTGPSESGKSTFLRQLALAIISKCQSFLNFPLNIRTGRVYYVATEDTIETVSQYLNKHFIDTGDVDALNDIVYLFNTDDLLSTLQQKLRYRNADVVIIDAWADTLEGSTNNLGDVRFNLEGYRGLVEEFGCLVIMIHHSVKNTEKSNPDKNKLNGSQAIEAKLRCVAEIRQRDNGDQRLFSILKCNYLSESIKRESIVLDFNADTLSFENNNSAPIDKSLITPLQGKSKKYDDKLWVPRMSKIRAEKQLTFEEARKVLETEYPNENLPGLTWFKENCKSASSKISAKSEGEETPIDNNLNHKSDEEQRCVLDK